MTIDLYEILGVKSDATHREIRKAFRRLSKEFHPDNNPEGREKFQEVAQAYKILGNDHQRSLYDQFGLDFKPDVPAVEFDEGEGDDLISLVMGEENEH